jgi:hypothetical protein
MEVRYFKGGGGAIVHKVQTGQHLLRMLNEELLRRVAQNERIIRQLLLQVSRLQNGQGQEGDDEMAGEQTGDKASDGLCMECGGSDPEEQRRDSERSETEENNEGD